MRTPTHLDARESPFKNLQNLEMLIAGGMSAGLGLLVMMGWHLHNSRLVQLLPTYAPMQYNTAFGLLLCGIGLVSIAFGRGRVSVVCGSLAGTVGLLTLIQYLFRVNLGLDQLLMKPYIVVKTFYPGRMPPNAALCFVLIGTGLIVMGGSVWPTWRFRIVGPLSAMVIAIGTAALLGYLLDLKTAYSWQRLTQMSIHTAFGLVTLGIGMTAFTWGNERSEEAVIGVLGFSLIVTLTVWTYTQENINAKARARFLHEIELLTTQIERRVDTSMNPLHSIQRLFETHELISSEHFIDACENLELNDQYPAIHSICYMERFWRDAPSPPVGGPRASPQSTPVDGGGKEEFRPIYLFPPEHPNARPPTPQFWGAGGLLSHPMCRVAFEVARDTGKPRATRRTVFITAEGKSIPVFFIFLPVYRYGLPLSTVAERRAAVQGMLMAVCRWNAFLADAFRDMVRHPDIEVERYEEEKWVEVDWDGKADAVIYSMTVSQLPRFSAQFDLDLDRAGQVWRFSFSTPVGSRFDPSDESLPLFVLGAGLIFSLLITTLVYVLIRSRWRAQQIAEAITRKLEAQNALVVRSDRLRSLGEMAAGIAHELNQPLAGVRGLAEHLLVAMDRGWNVSEASIREKLAMIVEQADRMTHIIQHVRVFSREAGKPELRAVNVNDVVQSSVDLLEAQFRFRGLHLKTEFTEGLPPVWANPFSLEEVVLNLMSNARDAVQERVDSDPDMTSPEVILRTALAHSIAHSIAHHFSGGEGGKGKQVKRSEIPPMRSGQADQRSGGVQIEVIDNGIGIPPAVQEKIFNPFFTTKDPQKGTGARLIHLKVNC